MYSKDSRKTPLNSCHRALGAKMVPFGGWDMPVSYEGVLAEHAAVRNQCGIFDVSHMGEIRVMGPEAQKFLLGLAMNDVSKLKTGEGQYSGLLLPTGGMIDDMIVYRLGDEEFFICVNASNADKDFSWIHEHAHGIQVTVTNESDSWAQLAIQGPNSLEATLPLFALSDHGAIRGMAYMNILPLMLMGQQALIARTGYTGEKGYEIYLRPVVAEKAWKAALETAPKTGIKPIGLGARDTLRLEACYLLYGNDMDDMVTPLEAGVAWAVKLSDRGDFIGRDPLLIQKQEGLPRKIFAFKMLDQAIGRAGMEVFLNGKLCGKVTSGSPLPTLGGAGGMALLSSKCGISIGSKVEIDIRGKRKLAEIVTRPLYSARVKS